MLFKRLNSTLYTQCDIHNVYLLDIHLEKFFTYLDRKNENTRGEGLSLSIEGTTEHKILIKKRR